MPGEAVTKLFTGFNISKDSEKRYAVLRHTFFMSSKKFLLFQRNAYSQAQRLPTARRQTNIYNLSASGG